LTRFFELVDCDPLPGKVVSGSKMNFDVTREKINELPINLGI
jgi:hypothetical protein